MNNYLDISDISFINSNIKNKNDIDKLYSEKSLSDSKKWHEIMPSTTIEKLAESINSRLRNRMSQLTQGVYNALEEGPGKNITENEEICLFTGFGEIETTNIIIKTIVLDKFKAVSPTHFHNSVHHTALGYYTIINKMHNSCITISDGLETNHSFINYIRFREKLNKNLVVVYGDEYSPFYELDCTCNYKIVPAFVSYRIKPFSDRGIRFGGILNDLEELEVHPFFKEAKTVFSDKETFVKLENNYDKRIISEYPLMMDNPGGVILRCALPFYLDVKGKSIILESINKKIYFFEVNL